MCQFFSHTSHTSFPQWLHVGSGYHTGHTGQGVGNQDKLGKSWLLWNVNRTEDLNFRK